MFQTHFYIAHACELATSTRGGNSRTPIDQTLCTLYLNALPTLPGIGLYLAA
jgi:hypothetical protein